MMLQVDPVLRTPGMPGCFPRLSQLRVGVRTPGHSAGCFSRRSQLRIFSACHRNCLEASAFPKIELQQVNHKKFIKTLGNGFMTVTRGLQK
jgi:hypothetical protein